VRGEHIPVQLEQPHKWISLVSRKCKKILKKFNLVITSQAKKSPQQDHNVHFDPNLEFKGLFMINLKLRIEFTTDQAYQYQLKHLYIISTNTHFIKTYSTGI